MHDRSEVISTQVFGVLDVLVEVVYELGIYVCYDDLYELVPVGTALLVEQAQSVPDLVYGRTYPTPHPQRNHLFAALLADTRKAAIMLLEGNIVPLVGALHKAEGGVLLPVSHGRFRPV